MKKNLGSIDRILRALFAILLGVLYYTGVIGGLAAIVLGVVAVVLLATSVMGFCPLYAPFGISTCGKIPRTHP